MKEIKGYIIRTIDYKESAKLLYAYTEQGIISMVAHGVKKMNSPLRHIAQTGMMAMLTLSSGKLPTLKEATLIDYYPNIKKDFNKHHVMYSIHDYLLYNTHEHDDHLKLFLFIEKVLSRLNSDDLSHELLLTFELKFLHFLGIGLNFKQCPICQTQAALVFDLNHSSVYCHAHADQKHQLYDETITRYLRTYYYGDVLTIDLNISEAYLVTVLYEITDYLYQTHLGFNSKAKSILKTLL